MLSNPLLNLHLAKAADLAAFQQYRQGEERLGQALLYPEPSSSLSQLLQHAKDKGAKFVVLGVPEDIGPRANFGQAGAVLGWQAFLQKFINLQHTHFLNPREVLLLGSLNCDDLQQQSLALSPCNEVDVQSLRELCQQIDERLEPVIFEIFASSLTPIVIGGGHNNALPLLSALSRINHHPINAINLDPHADFRLLEGRHSGNGFSYAKKKGVLHNYLVMGLHELKNSAAALAALKEADVDVLSYQSLFVRTRANWPQLLNQWIETHPEPFGIELDTDSITGMPVSAYNSCGLSVQQAEHYVYLLAQSPQSRYLHLAEAAPALHPAGLQAGLDEAGQILSALVCAFLMAKQQAPGK